ncbi:bifunctional helix-turn-helix transcriptional regulator/GNAT family N-acetyltransferase [Fulvivirgaceae bacterium BMA10]|uniref:Bifunctional helix-turn-helix transcriptional regulator/GNAT family N-acetyltransferase n=1 Tax=Splendidivirga corallicola TaxID=3051826 RepID=A0ABT8KSM7_9BACT|nr:bifunctional helix-turn-helix transcriptional regulator/GNAT family N-acetyltransferase [Fulvivirgaceae bacterium BMA10]
MNVLNQLGELALGSRLRRLSDQIMREGVEIYKNNGIDFEAKFFPIFYLLLQKSHLSVTEISIELGLAHPSVIQTLREMERRKLITSVRDKKDGRKRLVALTQRAMELSEKMEPVWNDIATAMHDMIATHKHNILSAMESIENDFLGKGLADRVVEITTQRKLNEVEIIDYDQSYARYFKDINYEWIEKYFTIEAIDKEVLENHKTYILDKGGHIFFAKYHNDIVGTCALIKFDDEKYELSKMGVMEGYQGKQIGKKLGLAIIDKAKEKGAKTLFLDSNRKLVPAINLYKRLGFKTINNTNESVYQRSNISMELDLTKNEYIQ